MKDLKVFEHDNVDVVDSREVARLVDRPHNDLMKSIRSYADYISNAGDFSLVDFFIPSTYKDGKGEIRPCYLLTKKGCDMVANKMTGEKGVLFTAAYVTAFEAMRERIAGGALVIPKDYPAALRALADMEEQKMALEAENEQQRQVIADFEPIKRYVDTILESPGAMATSQIAADYDMSARQLNKILHEEGVQHCVNGQWLLYRRHMGQGYTKSKTFTFDRSDGRQDAKTQTYWTQKGRLWLNEILNRRGIYAIMDRGAVS